MNARPWKGTIFLAVVVALAGCSLPFGAQSQSPGAGDGSPPGVSNGVLENETTLLDAHVASSREHGYRIEETAGDARTVYVAASNFSSFRVVPGQSTSNPAIWANETLTLARLDRGGETVYQRPPRHWAGPRQMTGAESLRSLFDQGTYTRDGTADCDGRSCTLLTATNGSRYENFSAEARVDESGIVHRFDATYDAPTEDESATVEYRLAVTQLGNVAVERPPWVGEAIAETG